MSDPRISDRPAIESDFDLYQRVSLGTMANDLMPDTRLAVLGLGIAGEAGECADVIKKVLGHGHPLDAEKLMFEIGDVLFYAAVLADQIGYTLSEVAEANMRKLAARYGPGGFTKEKSMNRISP